MKIKVFPKNERELTKLFVVLFPLVLILNFSVSFLRDSYFSFSNLLPHSELLNYGFLSKLSNQSTYGILFATSLALTFTYLFSKSLGRLIILFPLVFLTLIGLSGIETLDFLVSFFDSTKTYTLGNSSILLPLKLLIIFGLIGISSINILAKKEHSIFSSAQFLFGSLIFYFISLLVIRSGIEVFSDALLINIVYTSTHIYVGTSFVYLAIVHFLMSRPLGAVIYSKTLTSITFWGYLFLLPWTGFKYYYGSILPNWIENVSIYLSFSLIIPLLAVTVNFVKTTQTKTTENLTSLSLLNFSFVIFCITNILHIVASYENLLPILGLTNFVNTISLGYVAALTTAMISFTYYLVPKLFGRDIIFSKIEQTVFFIFKLGYFLHLVNNILIGINTGYVWNAAANAGSPALFGEGFSVVWNLIGFNYSLNIFTSLLLLLASLLFFVSVIRGVTSGPITTVEEMVTANE